MAEAETWYRKGLDVWLDLQSQHALWAADVNYPNGILEKIRNLEHR
jgi:plasmid maintenance system antidote protein VapI